MEEKRTLIETFLPVEEISAEAKKEKLGRAKPPTSLLHYWWTRKPLVASRATVLGALLPEDYDITEFKRLLGFRDDQKKRAHNYDLSKNQLTKLNNTYKDFLGSESPTILDPFGGGGSIPFETLRMGCNALSNDYNPVAYLIQRATLEFPLIYGEELFKDVEVALKWLLNKAKEDLGYLYPTHDGKEVATYIYAWIVSCPDCGFENPLVGQWLLSRKKNIFLNPILENKTLTFEIKQGTEIPPGTMKGGKGKCLSCGKTIPNEHIKNEIHEKTNERLLAVVLLGKNGKEYDLPFNSDIEAINLAKKILKDKWDEFLKNDLIPLEKMPLGDVRSAKYLEYWYKIFNPRQLLLFIRLTELIQSHKENFLHKISGKDDRYFLAIAVYMAFSMAKHIDYNCRLTSWHRRNQQIAHALTARGIPIMWDHTEVNPFVKTSGSLIGMQNDIKNSLKYSIEKLRYSKSVTVDNVSITNSEFKAPIIITDPPYFDDVQYSELSEIFYTFEHRALRNLIDLPIETPKSEDLSVSKKRSNELFEQLFNSSCLKMNSMLTDDGLLIMYFAHSSIQAWDFVVNSLRNSNFRITATWPIHTENPNNPMARGHASIMSSIVICARKRTTNRSGFIEEIKDDLKEYLESKLAEFWEYGLRGADITVAAMGASLNILTEYSEIKSYSGEMTVKDILELVEVYVVEFILGKFLKDSESLDSPTRFYIYCRLSQLDGMSFDTANLISKSLHMDLKLLESSGIINSITSGKNKGIKLVKYDERNEIEVKSLIDAVQASMIAYENGGMKSFEAFSNETKYSNSDIFNVINSMQHLDPGDKERQIALLILGKSDDLIPEKGQTTLK